MLHEITKHNLNGEITYSNNTISCKDEKYESSIEFLTSEYGMCKTGNFLECVLHFSKHTGEFSTRLTFDEFVKRIAFSTIGSETTIYRPDVIMLNIKENVTNEKWIEFIDNGGYSLVYNQQQWVKWLNTVNTTPTIKSAEYILKNSKSKDTDDVDPSTRIEYKNVNYLFDIEVDDNEIENLNMLVSKYMMPDTYIKIEQFYIIYARAYNLDYSELPCVKFIKLYDEIELMLKDKKDQYDEQIKSAKDAANSDKPVE